MKVVIKEEDKIIAEIPIDKSKSFADQIVEAYMQGHIDTIVEVKKELNRLCNIDCPQGCYCVDNQECCPYLECITDINNFLKQLNGDI